MAKLREKESNEKAEALLDAIEKLKKKTDSANKNLVTIEAVLEEANKDKRVKQYSASIGRSSLASPRGEGFVRAKKLIDEFKKEYKLLKKLAGKQVKTRVKHKDEVINSLDAKLQDSEQKIIILQEKIHSLQRTINNKEQYIKVVEKDRDNFVKIIKELRDKHERA